MAPGDRTQGARGAGSTAAGGGVQAVGTKGSTAPDGPGTAARTGASRAGAGDHGPASGRPDGGRTDGDRPHGDRPESPDEKTSAGTADGPFTSRQLFRIDEALSAADRETGLTFSVYVSELDEPTRAAAARLLERLPHPAEAVLVAVSPGQRVLEIVTGADTVRRLPDRVCALAALSMTASFGGGDLTGGIVTGLRMLADSAAQGTRSGRGAPAECSAGDPTV